MIKKILLTVAATAALVSAMPAAAQSYGDRDRDGRGGYDQRRDYDRGAQRGSYQRQRWNRGTRNEWAQARRIDMRQARLDQRLDMLVRRRALSLPEARTLQGWLHSIETVEQGYKRSNRDLSRQEVRHLHRMMDKMEGDMNRRARS